MPVTDTEIDNVIADFYAPPRAFDPKPETTPLGPPCYRGKLHPEAAPRTWGEVAIEYNKRSGESLKQWQAERIGHEALAKLRKGLMESFPQMIEEMGLTTGCPASDD